jgi:hypothetical protein
MAKYRVNRYRMGYASDEVTVEAKNEAEAIEKADNGDFSTSENDADYKFEAYLIEGEPTEPEPAWYIASNPLAKPLTTEQVKALMKDDGRVSAIVAVDIDEVIAHDYEGFLDLLEEKMLEHGVLSDISYKVVDSHNDILNIRVEGFVMEDC